MYSPEASPQLWGERNETKPSAPLRSVRSRPPSRYQGSVLVEGGGQPLSATQWPGRALPKGSGA